MKKQDFFRGSVILAMSAVITKLIGALFRIPLASLLGGKGMGYFSCAYGVFLPIYAVTAAGLPAAAAKVVSQDIRLRGGASLLRIKRTSLIVFGGAGVIGSILTAFGAYPFCRYAVGNLPALPAVLMIAPSVGAGCMSAVLRGFYEGMNNMYPTAFSQAAEACVKLAAGLAGVYLVLRTASEDPRLFLDIIRYAGTFPDKEKLSALALSFAAAAGCAGVSLSCIAGLAYMLIYDAVHKKEYIRPAADGHSPAKKEEIINELARVAVPAALCALVTNITSMIDLATVMNSLRNAAERSPQYFRIRGISPEDIPNFYYGSFAGLAVTVFNLVPSVTNMFGRSIIPSASAAHAASDRKALGKCTLDVIYLTALAAVPCGIGISVLAEPILKMLFSGASAEAETAAGSLAVMGPGMIMLCISSAIFSVFQAAGRADLPVKLMAVGAAVKAAGNILLVPVPQLNIIGAAVSTDISYAVILAGSLLMIKKTIGTDLKKLLTDLSVVLFCGMLCGASAYCAFSVISRHFGTSASVMSSVACGGIFYIISTYLSGIIGKTTLKMTISQK